MDTENNNTNTIEDMAGDISRDTVKETIDERFILKASPGLRKNLAKEFAINQTDEIKASRTNKLTKDHKGKFIVIDGPMFGGKSSTSESLMVTNAVAGRQVLLLSFKMDTRYGVEAGIKTHNGHILHDKSHENITVCGIESDAISKFLDNQKKLQIGGADIIAIDEVHFWKSIKQCKIPNDAAEYMVNTSVIVREMIAFLYHVVDVWGMDLIFAGINLWASGLPSPLTQMLPYADKHIPISAVCEICNKKKAKRTIIRDEYNLMLDGLLSDDKMNKSQVKVGGRAGYLPICRSCFTSTMAYNVSSDNPEEYHLKLMRRLYPQVML